MRWVFLVFYDVPARLTKIRRTSQWSHFHGSL